MCYTALGPYNKGARPCARCLNYTARCRTMGDIPRRYEHWLSPQAVLSQSSTLCHQKHYCSSEKHGLLKTSKQRNTPRYRKNYAKPLSIDRDLPLKQTRAWSNFIRSRSCPSAESHVLAPFLPHLNGLQIMLTAIIPWFFISTCLRRIVVSSFQELCV
jgi:hypothetical protein